MHVLLPLWQLLAVHSATSAESCFLLCRMDASFAALSICMSCVWLNLVASEVVSLLQTFGMIFNAPTVGHYAACCIFASHALSCAPVVSKQRTFRMYRLSSRNTGRRFVCLLLSFTSVVLKAGRLICNLSYAQLGIAECMLILRCCAAAWCGMTFYALWAVMCCVNAVLCHANLCRVVLCCAMLCCAALCCAVLRCAVLCCAVLCCAVLHRREHD